MSMDEGGSTISDNDVLRARLKAAMKEEGLSFPGLCTQADVSQDIVLRAIEQGTNGFPQTLPVFQKLSIVLGRGPDWLISGNGGPDAGFVPSLRERVRRIVFEFIYKADLPNDDAQTLIAHYEKVLRELTCATPHAAFRRGLPNTLLDVARTHQRLMRRRG
jgi:transcriptional regulator with XRE-family HTH domain